MPERLGLTAAYGPLIFVVLAVFRFLVPATARWFEDQNP
jgi:hypothetical protein